MRRLTLVRHANADWKDANYADFERPLNSRGLGEAEAISRLLLDNEPPPDLVLASTALRTRQTAEILFRVLGLQAQSLQFSQNLYLAPAGSILALAQAADAGVGHLVVVGHNPGVSDLARMLAPAGTVIPTLSTACACALTFDAQSWASLATTAVRAVVHAPTPRTGR